MRNKLILIFLCIFILEGCTDLSEEMFTSIGSDNFYGKKENVLQSISVPYAYAHSSTLLPRFFAQELTADQILTPTRGIHGYNAGEYLRYMEHKWTYLDRGATQAWNDNYSTVGFANNVINDLQNLDPKRIGMTDEEVRRYIAEIRTLRAFAYWQLLDLYGGVPLVSTVTNEVVGRSTAAETYEFIEKELNESLPQLSMKSGEGEPSYLYRMTQAANRFLLMRLYFNSEAYIGKPRYEETEELCREILEGKYGDYGLDVKWNGPFTWNNIMSPELIFAFPIERGQRDEHSWWFGGFHHYQSQLTFNDFHAGAGWNGWGLAPSITAKGENLGYELGMPFSRFNEYDLRKRHWNYSNNGNWEGMFLYGLQLTYDGKDTIRGTEEYRGLPLVLVDYVARVSEDDYDSYSLLKGEENTGIRPVKLCPPFPSEEYQAKADQPEMRLAEVHFTLAECLMRMGDRSGAAEHINAVVKRNYTAADWNNAELQLQVKAEDLDEDGYRMLEEWAKEFLMEGRRRMDLIRWNKFTTERWFNHEPSESYRRLMPIPEYALNANPLLEQNPGY